MSILSRSQVRIHTGPYQTISSNAPIGLLCLQELYKQEDSVAPNSQSLELVLARDFRDLENGSERSKPRQDVINNVLNRRLRYNKYQTDMSQCWCITNTDKSQTVLFEGIRFTVFLNDFEWIRVPLSGRLEVRPITRNGKPSGEIVQRKLTLDLSAFWRRYEFLKKAPKSPQSIKRNISPAIPPYAELEAPPRPQAPPKPEAIGDVPPPGVGRRSFIDRWKSKPKEPPQIPDKIDQGSPCRPNVSAAVPVREPRAQDYPGFPDSDSAEELSPSHKD